MHKPRVQQRDIKEDARGRLLELFKFPNVGQIFYSTTRPGKTRGNHYHRRKTEYFCVIEGKAKIILRDRTTNERVEHEVTGDQPEVVEMPVNWTHNIQNTGTAEMKLIVWVNEVFNPDDPDTFHEEV